MSVISEFTGTARFAVRRRLGSGGMGVVYLAHDRERGVDVALKTLAKVDARGIAGLKNEFRALAGLSHPNLVVLHELFSESGQWFFTMEVVLGVTFLEHVIGAGRGADPGLATALATVTATPPSLQVSPDADVTMVRGQNGSATGAPPGAEAKRAPTCDFARLRPALRQLAEAVQALHGAGKLHRDLKPSNVMVTPEGRVVILDFGLAVLHGERRVEPSAAARLIEGTPAYMAPEQTIGAPASPASDWYAVGAMLYEALTGRLPFTGDIRQILGQKRVIAPSAPSLVVSSTIPEDLDRLCVDLLRIAPDDRPAGLEVLSRLGAPASVPLGRTAFAEAPFVGRARELADLWSAFAAVREGRAVTVHLRGLSGLGKSALVEHFLDDVWRREGALVLSGRCYERESVPYKAWDSLVDALVRHLGRLTYEETVAVMPAHARDLARVFPVLHEVEVVDEQSDDAPGGDALESRRRAFDALRDLLHNLAGRRPLVLHLDDLQWGDADSARLMATLLAPPDPPPLLLLCSYRSEEAEGSEFFRELGRAETTARGKGQVVPLDLARLPGEESSALARALLGDRPDAPALAAAIAREADGSPFFVAELVRSVRDEGPSSAGSIERALEGVSLEGVLRGRIGRLPPEARRLLEVMAVAARPIEQAICARAAGVEAPHAALSALRAANLVRTRGLRPSDTAEPFHDRVRELVVKGLSPLALADAHLRLATELEAAGRDGGDPQTPGADAEVLAAHYEGAGERARAAEYAVRAAENATGALAFDRAAKLYRQALSLGAGATPAEKRALQIAQATALVNAGRGAEAAPVLLEAAAGASAREGLDLRRRAAEQFLLSGHIDRGVSVLREVLASVGVDYPASQARAVLSLLGRQALLRLRGTRFVERPPRDLDPAALARIDVCFSAGKGLTFVDPVRGFGFHDQHLLLSLDAGDPRRVCLGLAFQACNIAFQGGRAGARAYRVLDQARALAARLDEPYLHGVVGDCGAGVHMCLGRWRATVEAVARANEILKRSCSGVAWEIEGGIVCSEVSLLWMGRLDELAAFVESHVRVALDRGDLFAATYARMHTWYAPIAADDPARAHAEMREAIARWSRDGFHIMHFWALYAEAAYDLYAGDARGALGRLAARRRDLEGSNVLRVQFHRVWMSFLRGAAALGAALDVRGTERARRIAEAERVAAELQAEGMPYALPGASLVRAGALAARGRADQAIPDLEAAIAGFRGVDMALHAACARRRKGELLGGDEGRRLVEGADAAMRAQGIARPDRWTAMIAPGF
jgi:serine/threonine protein kinase